jgi:hypothetical protein
MRKVFATHPKVNTIISSPISGSEYNVTIPAAIGRPILNDANAQNPAGTHASTEMIASISQSAGVVGGFSENMNSPNASSPERSHMSHGVYVADANVVMSAADTEAINIVLIKHNAKMFLIFISYSSVSNT